MLTRLRNKFVAVIMVVTTILLCVLLALIYRFTAITLASNSIQLMQAVSTELRPSMIPPQAVRPTDRLHYFILTRTPKGDLEVVGILNTELPDREQLISIYNTAASSDKSIDVITEHALRYMRVESSRGTSYIFADISEELDILRSLRYICALTGTGAFFLILLLSYLLVSRIMKPVEESWQQQRQFVADASHELKTPLTVIMTNADLLTASEYSEEQKREFTDHILSMSARMRGLIDGMLDLARVDNGVIKTAFQPIKLSRLTENALLPFEPLFFESDRILDSHIEAGLTVLGSQSHLEQVIGILLDNALKYSAPHSTVVVTLQQKSRCALLCVDSCGQDIPQEELARIFRRFYTMDRSRTNGSCGLGLSIAEGIVREHGGKIWAESGGGHNRFYVRLPLS